MSSVIYPRVSTSSNDLPGLIANLYAGAKAMPHVNTREARTPAEFSAQFDHGTLAQAVEMLRARYQSQIRTPQFFAGTAASQEGDSVNVTELLGQFRAVYVELENKGFTGATRAFATAFPTYAHVSDLAKAEGVTVASSVAGPVIEPAESLSALNSVAAIEPTASAVEVATAAVNLNVEKASQANAVNAVVEAEEDPVVAFSRMRMGA